MIVLIKYQDGTHYRYMNIKQIDLENGFYALCKVFDCIKVPFYDLQHGSIDSLTIYEG